MHNERCAARIVRLLKKRPAYFPARNRAIVFTRPDRAGLGRNDVCRGSAFERADVDDDPEGRLTEFGSAQDDSREGVNGRDPFGEIPPHVGGSARRFERELAAPGA